VFAWFNGIRATCRTHPRAGAEAGARISLAFDLSKAILFDPASEQRLAPDSRFNCVTLFGPVRRSLFFPITI